MNSPLSADDQERQAILAAALAAMTDADEPAAPGGRDAGDVPRPVAAECHLSAAPAVDAIGAPAPYSPSPAAVTKPVGEGDDIRQSLAALHSRLERLETAVEATSKQISLLPAQVRTMGLKLDGVATSIAEPRYRDVLLGLLAVYDLVDQILRGLQGMKGTGDEAHAEHRRNYDVLRLHLLQVLAANGLTEIPASDVFDPTQHRAVQRVPTADRGLDGQVREVVRRGFRTERAVLRYAEVVVYRYASDACCGEMPQT